MTDSPTLKSFDKLNMEREKLLSSTNKYKQALENQVADLKENTVRFAIQGLVFGGVALGTYFLIRAFTKKTPEEKQEKGVSVTNNSFASTLFTSIQSYIISFLLSIAREKLTQYLEEHLLKENESASKNRA
jgi:hypothetical protein